DDCWEHRGHRLPWAHRAGRKRGAGGGPAVRSERSQSDEPLVHGRLLRRRADVRAAARAPPSRAADRRRGERLVEGRDRPHVSAGRGRRGPRLYREPPGVRARGVSAVTCAQRGAYKRVAGGKWLSVSPRASETESLVLGQILPSSG